MKTSHIRIVGMTCGGCVASVTQALQAMPGMQEVKVQLDPGIAEVRFDETQVDEAKVQTVLQEAGFDVLPS